MSPEGGPHEHDVAIDGGVVRVTFSLTTRGCPMERAIRGGVLRKTMAKLATVEQAARVAGLDADDLLARLNRALEGGAVEGRAGAAFDAPRSTTPFGSPDALPAFVVDTPPERIVEVDVREDLRAGREPFRRILDASRRLADDQVLRLRAIFEPAPLYEVLGRQGFEHHTERLGPEDWRVWFHRAAAPAGEVHEPPPIAAEQDADLVVHDVRGLEPPEPMVRTLEALARLPPGKVLVQINARVPRFLLPKLAERGFAYEVREFSGDVVRIFIRHANHPAGERTP